MRSYGDTALFLTRFGLPYKSSGVAALSPERFASTRSVNGRAAHDRS